MEAKKLASFSAANTFPLKLLRIKCLKSNRHIKPIHVQLNPTNRCNFACGFCSCSERQRQQELDLDSNIEIMSLFKLLGCKSVTITGGGEPTLHKNIDALLQGIKMLGVKIGLVTNGTLLHQINALDRTTWIRISASDQLEKQLGKMGSSLDDWLQNIAMAVTQFPSVDWAFSYVIGKKPSKKNILKLVDFANTYHFTHVRLVNDIFIAEELTGQMADVKNYLESMTDDSKVNYQDRSTWTRGFNPCYVSLLKPVVGADGYLYPCCGTQYALKDPSRDYEKTMRMGFWKFIVPLWRQQKFFDGSVCEKCYYSNYDLALDVMVNGLQHKEFV